MEWCGEGGRDDECGCDNGVHGYNDMVILIYPLVLLCNVCSKESISLGAFL